jgi:CBS domain-containing protein
MTQGPIEKLITRKVVSIDPECPALEVVSKLHAYRISCLVVCDQDVPVGIITEQDIVGFTYRHLAGEVDSSLPAKEFMSSPIFTVPFSCSVDDAILFAHEHRVRHLPVVNDEGELVGLLTQTDLLQGAGR